MESKAERRTFSDATKAGVSRNFKVGHTFNGRKYERPSTAHLRKKSDVIRRSDKGWEFEVESGKK